MIPRYTRKRMADVWEAENRYRKWLQIEIFACEAMADLGLVPRGALEEIQRRAGFDAARVETVNSPPEPGPLVRSIRVQFGPRLARWVRVRAVSARTIPDGHPAAGGNAWLFVDEILVNP